MLVQVDGVEEYEVERIEGERKIKGKKEFLIKWKGYSNTERIWEPLEHLDNVRNVLDEWTIQSSNRAPPTDQIDMDKSNKSDCDEEPKSEGKSSIPLCYSSRYKKSSP